MTENWINKMWHILVSTVEYYSALKRKDILIHVTKWMSLEDTVLSETSSHKNTYAVCFCLYQVFRILKFVKTESTWVLARGWGNRKWGVSV